MVNFVCLVITGVYISVYIHLSNQYESLNSLIIIHRHGDRTPLNTYPNDPYANDSFWPDGFGKLTKAGKLRMFKLGEYLRKRYSSFLSDNPLEVTARSSDAERCTTSAQLLLAGLYPPKQRWIWNEQIKWQPIAIHSLPMNIDGMLHATAPCPRWRQVNNLVQQTTAYIQYAAQFNNFFKFLTEKSGTNITNLKTAALLNEILTEEIEAGLQMPVWVTKSVLKQLDEISAKNHYFETITRLQLRLRAGMLFEEITYIVKQVKKSNKKLFIYSTHDTTLASVLSALHVFNGLNIPYSASIIFEIYGEHFENRTFKLYYLNDTENMNPISLKLPVCTELYCSVKVLIENIHDLLGINWQKECALLVHNESPLYDIFVLLIAIIGNSSKLIIIIYVIVAVVATTICIACLELYLHLHRSLHLKECRIK